MYNFLSRQLRALAPMFRPPFDGLWLAMLFYYIWCFMVHPDSQILRGSLPDPDDYMYLDQVLDWIKGQGWFDNVQHRLDPPTGGLIHFSRLPQIPMAAITLFFEFLGLPARGAAMLMAIVEPLLLLAAFFLTIRWVGESLMPKKWAGVTAYVTVFSTGLIEMFQPGHVDHHGLVVLLVAAALGCALRMMHDPDDIRWGLGAGFLLALTLTVALEVLPWIIVISGWLGLWAIVKGGKAAYSGFIYSLALYLGSAGFLLISQPLDVLTLPDVTIYSITYVYFVGGIAAIFAGIALAARMHAVWRWVLAVGIAGVTGVAFLAHYPDLLGGPWGGVNKALASIILDNITEALPLIKLESTRFKAVVDALGPLIAFGANLFFLKTARPNERWLWGLMAILLAAAFLLTAFYQYRFIGGLNLFGIVPLAALLQRGWGWIGREWQGRRKVFAEIGLLLLVGPLTAVLLPALADGRSFNTGVLLFPVHSTPYAACDTYGLERVLRSPQLYAGKPRVIMNTMGLGPELLFRTPDMVVSAPYHEDVAGNLDAVRFFSTTDPAKAEAIARRHHAELVITCMLVPSMYTNIGAIRQVLPDSTDKSPNGKASPPFILQLLSGKHLPKWLKPVHSPILRNYVVYEITPPSPRAGKPPKAE